HFTFNLFGEYSPTQHIGIRTNVTLAIPYFFNESTRIENSPCKIILLLNQQVIQILIIRRASDDSNFKLALLTGFIESINGIPIFSCFHLSNIIWKGELHTILISQVSEHSVIELNRITS